MPRLFRAIVTSVILASTAHAGVLINEIMYRPGTAFPEDTRREFIELHNTDLAPVNIAGWALTSGVSYTFPVGTTIPAGGFVLVAADPNEAELTYGRDDFFGPWVGSLSNNSERVRLSMPGLVPGTFDKVDEVTYASEGDWATRVREFTFGGWDWSTGATLGRSAEVRNPALSNDNGQNWAASAALGGTPGVANSALTANVAPVIKAVKHFPPVPRTTDPVRISCELNDETLPAGLTATLFLRNATSQFPGGFQSVAMTGDGAGKFSVTLPAFTTNLTIVEFYISASDGTLTRTWPAATSEGQNANCQFQVDNEVDPTTDSYYRLVLTGAENAAFDNVSDSSDRQFNQTLISSRAGETTVRYRASMRIRGNSSRSYQFRPLRISMPNDDSWNGITDFNLHPKASHVQFLGMRIMQAAGLPSSDAIPVELRRNGVESTTSGGSTPDFGKWVRVEPENTTYISRHFPAADTGNLYTKRSPERYWRSSGWTVPNTPTGTIDTWSKQNNSGANDWSDLTQFFTVVQQVSAVHFPGASPTDVSQSTGGRLSGTGLWNGTPLSAGELATLGTVADLDSWARWFAAMTIMQDLETNISNGVDDDYGIYFAPNGTGQRRANLIVHDLDTIFGRGDNKQPATYTDLYDMTEDGQSDYAFRTLLPLIGTATQPGNAVFRQKYLDAIRELYGSFFNADTNANPNPPFYRFIDEHFAGWSSSGAFATEVAAIKTFATQRQAHLLALIGQGAIIPPTATSTSTLAATAGIVVINEVLANNVAAHANGTDFPDTIELFNSGATAVDLSTFTLTDDPTLPAKFTFAAGTMIGAGEYLVVYADANIALPGIHVGFALDQDGDQVQLRDGATLLDSVSFGPQPVDLSICRNGATWSLCAPSIGAVNTASVALSAPSAIRINEWGANPDYLIGGDFIELYNPGTQPVAIGGMHVTDDLGNFPERHTFPALSFIQAGGFLRLNARSSSGNATELEFSLNADFGYVAFTGANNTLVDRVDIIGQPRDMSQGRSPDGADTFVRFSLPTNPPSPGASNVAPPANVLNLINFLRITEILFRPNVNEFIEFTNIGNVTLDLSGVQFTAGIGYTFEQGTMLAPGAFLVVCKDRAQFDPTVPLAAGVFTGTLDNAGETIALQPPSPWNINILNFSYETDWFVDATANHSFVVGDAATTAARDWNEKETWGLSTQPLGSPGIDGPPILTSGLTANATAGSSFSYQITASKTPQSFDATPLPAGLNIDTATGLISGIPSVDGVFNITISATNSAGTDTDTLVLTIVAPPLPVITSPLAVNGSIDVLFSYQIVATSNPTSYAATGLPAWLSFDAPTRTLSGTPPAIGVFNVTISATNFMGTDTETLVIDVAAVGPFSHFKWENVSTQIANTPFTATLRAVDIAERTVDYDGPATVGAQAVSSMSVVLTEAGCSSPTPDYFEIQNLSASAVNTTGWFVITSRSGQGVNVPLATAWALPASLASGQIVGATDGTPSTNEVYYGTDIDWANNGPSGWVMLSDASGVIRDFVAWGYNAAELATINFTFAGFNYTLGSQWTGDGAAIPFSGTSLFRSGIADSNDASNWTVAATPTPRGAQNSGLTVTGPLATLPVNAVLVDGTWTGSVSILDVAQAQLTATAGAAPVALSNVFELTAPTLNTPPTFTKGANATVPMDSGVRTLPAWATGIRAGASSETAQVVSFSVLADNTALFSTQPAVATNGTLTFTPALHALGTATITITPQDDGGTAGGGIDTGSAQTFTITVSPNLAPTFVKGANISVGEDTGVNTRTGWATSITAGAGETGQTLTFTVTNDNNSLFSTQPAVEPNGTLTFTLIGETPGVATVSITAIDDSGSGTNSSATQTFTITALAVNNAPSFTKGADLSVRHNVGAQTVTSWATAINAGEVGQTLAFEVSTPQTTLFITQPVISPTGTLTYFPHPHRSGIATITATLRDNGGTANGGVDFVTQTFTITTRAVNDAPSFIASTTSISTGIGGVYTSITPFATSILAGPPDESAQTVSFLLTNDRPDLFTSTPTLLSSGVLTFTAGSATGRATLTIRAKDNGGVLDGGVDESPAIVLNIRIMSVAEAIGTYHGLVEPAATVTRVNDNVGGTKITVSKGGKFSGVMTLGGQKFPLKGTINDTGVVKFSVGGNASLVIQFKTYVLGQSKPNIQSLIVALKYNVGENPSFTADIKPAVGAVISSFTATRSIYNGKTALVPTALLDPLTDKGKYAAAFLALTAPNNTLTATEYPQGDGVGALTISKTGAVTLKGKLADGTAYAMSSALLIGDTIPLYVPLYGAKGSLAGVATARSQATSDVDGTAFHWFRPAIIKPAHPGWPTGITVDLTATKILPKQPPLFPALAATDADGNATIDLTDAALGTKAVNIDVKNKITVITPAADKLKASTSAAKGTWSGSFVKTSPITGKPVTHKYNGVILRKAGYATGYYLDGIPGGRVRITPAP